MKKISRLFAHMVFGIRNYNDKCIKNFAKGIKNKKILELGSGTHKFGDNYYSAKRYFDSSNEFVQSDINPEYGHEVVDITNVSFENEYDIILCMNVLEHVFDYQKAVDNLYKATKKGGQVAVFVPMYYPLHDEPHDYWRFTEHALRKIFGKFSSISIQHKGLKQFAVAYFAVIKK